MSKSGNHYRTKQLGAAVIGLGVGEQHAYKLASLPLCELLWLFDIDQRKVERVLANLGQGKAAESYEQILNDERVNLVVIASYDDAHFEQTVAALEAGKHVFVEKPLCRSVAELQVIKEKWLKQNGKVQLTSNLVLRAAPLYQWLERQLDKGILGVPYALDGEYLYGRLEKITQGWRKDVVDYSVMFGGGIHLVDLMLWLLKERPQTVFARGNQICTEGTEFRYFDFVTSVMTFPNACICRITANFGCVHRHQHVLRLYGTQGTFLYDDSGARWHYTRDENVTASPITAAPLPAHKGALLPNFIEAVLNQQDLTNHTQQMFDVISVCAAVDEAVQTQRTVEVNYV